MPKMKSKSGAAKRFRALGGGGFKRSHAFMRHILTKKSTKRKRQLRGMETVNASNHKAVARMLPYAYRRPTMPRVKRGVTARASHKKILDAAKGYRCRRKNVFRIANEAVMKAGQYAYRDRRQRKRQFRALWIARINAAARQHGLT